MPDQQDPGGGKDPKLDKKDVPYIEGRPKIGEKEPTNPGAINNRVEPPHHRPDPIAPPDPPSGNEPKSNKL